MPFASINPTNPRTDPRNFHKKILRIDRVEKLPFFWVGHFEFFLQKKNISFASFQWKHVKVYWSARIFWNFDDNLVFQPKTKPTQKYAKQCIYYQRILFCKSFRGGKFCKEEKISMLKLLPYNIFGPLCRFVLPTHFILHGCRCRSPSAVYRDAYSIC